jgi:hypothetical protein
VARTSFASRQGLDDNPFVECDPVRSRQQHWPAIGTVDKAGTQKISRLDSNVALSADAIADRAVRVCDGPWPLKETACSDSPGLP